MQHNYTDYLVTFPQPPTGCRRSAGTGWSGRSAPLAGGAGGGYQRQQRCGRLPIAASQQQQQQHRHSCRAIPPRPRADGGGAGRWASMKHQVLQQPPSLWSPFRPTPPSAPRPGSCCSHSRPDGGSPPRRRPPSPGHHRPASNNPRARQIPPHQQPPFPSSTACPVRCSPTCGSCAWTSRWAHGCSSGRGTGPSPWRRRPGRSPIPRWGGGGCI